MGRFTVVPDFIAAQYTTVPPLEHADLSGQTVLVVGANAGLGLSAAKHFARLSPGKLALACRSVKKGEDAAKEIREETGFENILCYAVDLGVFASVVAFAEEFQRQEGRLDILMYNAGISTTDYERTTDGWETTLQVNDLSCMLLTVSLLPLVVKTSEMTKTAPYRPRIVIVASEGHYWVKPTAEELTSTSLFEKLSDPEYCKQSGVMGRRYFFSKLLNVLYARELASRISSSTAIVNSVNPGLCRSSLARRATLPQRIVFGIILSLLARTSEVGGRLLTWAAVSARHREKDLHGKFITDMQVREESDFAVSPEGYTFQRKLWDESVKILSSASPQFKDIVDRYLSQ